MYGHYDHAFKWRPTQETCVIPFSRVSAWLFTISPNKVAPELAEKVRLYREECADVLDRHFRGKVQSAATIDPAAFVEELRRMVSEEVARAIVQRADLNAFRIDAMERNFGPEPVYVSVKSFRERHFPSITFPAGEMSSWGRKLKSYCDVNRIRYLPGSPFQYPKHIVWHTLGAFMGEAFSKDRSQGFLFDFKRDN